MNTRLPATLSVPIAFGMPGINVPPFIVTPGAIPVPPSVVPAFTVTPLDDEISPVSKSVPPVTVVAPV